MNHLEPHEYALIKNGKVFNTAVSGAHDSRIEEALIAEFQLDCVVSCCEFGKTQPGETWNGNKFIPISPFTSWIWNDENNVWEAPIEKPIDGNAYIWDENSLLWTKDEENGIFLELE